MRDLNEQLNSSQNSRAKFKQRVAGGAVLLIVLAIFLPFIFNHSHMGNTATLPVQNAPADQTQAQPTVNTSVNTSAAPVAPSAPAEQQVAQQNPAETDQSMRSDQPGLTSPQSESAAPAQQPAAQQPATSAAASQPTQPVNAVPAQPVQPEQSTNNQPAAQLAVPATPAPAVSANPAPPAVAKVKLVHAAAAKHSVPSPVAHGNWMVQVGSFSQAEYATKLVAKLRAHGMPAYTQRESNHLVRVYVGPLADQQQAHKVQQKVAAEFQLNGLVSKKHV